MKCSGWESGFSNGPGTCADIGEIGLTSERERESSSRGCERDDRWIALVRLAYRRSYRVSEGEIWLW